MINEILLRRKNKLLINYCHTLEDNIDRVVIMCKNINSLGYTFSKDFIDKARYMSKPRLNELYKELVTYLKQYRGADKVWSPMYPNFPEQVEYADDWELFVNAIVHYMSGGKLVPKYEKDERLPMFESPDLTVLDFGDWDDLDEIMNNLILSKTSLSETDKADMIWIINNRGINNLPDVIPFKENVAVICKIIMDNTSEFFWYNYLHQYLKTATDILRFVTYLSDGDVSLSDNTKFKSLPQKQRRFIIRLLENAGNIEEDMVRHKNKWLRVGEILHPAEYGKFYPKVNRAFKKIRNNEKIETFGGILKQSIKDRNLNKTLAMLKNRPGEFARSLDELIRDNITGAYTITNQFSTVANKVSVPVLLQVREHFMHRNDMIKNGHRVFFPKGTLSKVWTTKNELDHLSKNICDEIVKICEDAIIEQFKSKDTLGKVYIDNSFKGYCVPQSQRSASKSMRNITRGSRFGIKPDSKFIRLGIHWMNEINEYEERRTDIDLSVTFLDENFGYIDHVSYTRLRNEYCVHSGDFVDAPRVGGGTAEFIDINIDKAKAKNVKYAAVQVYGFTFTKFCDLDDMVFTWQEGEEQNCGDIFEPSRVQQCINLGGNTDCEIPVVFDLDKMEVVWCDLALTTRTNFARCVEGNVRGVFATVMGICQSFKPQMYDLAMLNAKARGTIVTDRNEADVIFDLNTSKPVTKTEKFIETVNEKGEVIGTRTEVVEVEKDCRIITPYDIDVFMGEML